MAQPFETATIVRPEMPASALQSRELSAQRLLMTYVITGLLFMLLPGTFLGVWNLISISGSHGAAVSTTWIQAHGHAQIFGWIGTFILGIGFYSIPKMAGRPAPPVLAGWIAWLFWTTGVLLRWSAGIYQGQWRIAFPASAALEMCAFLIFLVKVRSHRSAPSNAGAMPVWILSVLVGTISLGLSLLMNLLAAAYIGFYGATPAFPTIFEARLLVMLTYGFIVPTVWGFSARWLPVFLGLRAVNQRLLRLALLCAIVGVLLALAGLFHTSPWFLVLASIVAIVALHLFEKPERPAKIVGVHASFPVFVRIAYVWLVIAADLGVCAAYFDHTYGWIGASRHALTVGFISTMVFAIGQRVLPAFAGMRLLYSPRLMFASLVLLNVGCALRVSSEALAYEGYWPPAWRILPCSAVCELMAVTVFAANLMLTFKQPPAHQAKLVSIS